MGLGTSPQSESVLKLIETLYCGVVPYKIIWARRLSEPRGTVHSGHGPARHFPARREHLFRACCLGIYSNVSDAGGHSTRYLSRGARWTIACDAQKRGLLAHLGASAGPPCRLIYYKIIKRWENTMYRLTISLRVLSPTSSIPLRFRLEGTALPPPPSKPSVAA